MASIHGANLKSSLSKKRENSRPKILNDLWVPKPYTHPKRRLRSRLKASNMIFEFQESRFKSRISTTIKGPVSIMIKARVSTAIKGRVLTTIKSCISNSNQEPRLFSIESHVSMAIEGRVSTPLNSCLHLISITTTSMRCVFTYIQRLCLFFCNQFNSTLTKAIDNSTVSIVHRRTNQSL